MKLDGKKEQLNIQERLSELWIVVMFTMAFADILSFILPEFFTNMVKGTTDVKITQVFLLCMALFVQIPIIMIYLSRILSRKIGRWVNTIASIITILFVIVGGSSYLHYIFFASIEVLCLLSIIGYSWRWKSEEETGKENA